MKTINISTIDHVLAVKSREHLRGGAYYDVIIGGKLVQIYPHISGWRKESAAIYHDGRWDVVVGDKAYQGFCSDAGPDVRYRSEAKPAAELYQQIGFAIDVEA